MAFKKSLGVFTERETRAEMIKIEKLGQFSIASDNAIRVVSGAGEVEGQPWEEESAIRVSPGKGIALSAHQDTEILMFTLPLLS